MKNITSLQVFYNDHAISIGETMQFSIRQRPGHTGTRQNEICIKNSQKDRYSFRSTKVDGSRPSSDIMHTSDLSAFISCKKTIVVKRPSIVPLFALNLTVHPFSLLPSQFATSSHTSIRISLKQCRVDRFHGSSKIVKSRRSYEQNQTSDILFGISRTIWVVSQFL
jgi:hypothetical protein